MDIAGPKPEEQAGPKPWIVPQHCLDKVTLVRREIAERPQASVEDIVDELARRNVRVSSTLSAAEMLRYRMQRVKDRGRRRP